MDVLAGSRDPILRRRIAYVLGGWQGRIVTTGKSGLVLIEALDHDFDLIILDTCLDGMGGRETLDILRQVRPRLPVLFLHRAEDDISDAVQKGGGRVGALVRTADEVELVRAAEELISKVPGQENRVPFSL